MKRKLVVLILFGFAVTLLLSSCSLGGLNIKKRVTNIQSRLYDNDESTANTRMNKILDAIQKKDKNSLEGMFSKKAIENSKNFDKSIDDLFDFFQGTVISINDWGGPGESDGVNCNSIGDNYKILDSRYDVVTGKQKYRFAIREFMLDTTNPDNVGIRSLYIINAKNTDEQYAYWGYNKWTYGINILRQKMPSPAASK